jgi:hypothetical protein
VVHRCEDFDVQSQWRLIEGSYVMVRTSKKLYVGALATTLTLALLSLIPVIAFIILTPGSLWLQQTFGMEAWGTIQSVIASLAVLAGALFLIVQITLNVVLIYKMWASIQDGHARTTPGKAIGFLFIPFFSLYWICQVWGGFPTDYNKYVERHGLNVPRLGSGIYSAYPALILLSLIPFLNIVTALVSLFVFFVITAKTCDAVNRLADAAQGPTGVVSQINASPRRAVG